MKVLQPIWVGKYFPKENKLHKIFNKIQNTTKKVTYSCIQNMIQIINNHSRINAVQRTQSINAKPDKGYIGLSDDEWKKRCYNHRKSFHDQCYQSETMLSSYVWETKRGIDQTRSLK